MDPVPLSEEIRDKIARLPEEAKGALIQGGFEIFEINPSSVATIMEAMRGIGLKVEWADELSEADRMAIAAELVPGAEVALKRNTRGHPKIYDKLLPYEAIEEVKDWGEAFTRIQPGARGIMGSAGLHLALLYKDFNSQVPEKPIYAGFTDGVDVRRNEEQLVRIRTYSSTIDGKFITIELSPGKIKLVPQYNFRYEPELGQVQDPGGIVSARTYLPIVPELIADRLQPRHELNPPRVITTPQA